MPFVKLDCTMIDKSIWNESAETKVVWITILAMADADGMVEAAIPGIASRAKISLEDTEKAIEKFQKPDKYSSNQANEGRRIEKIIGGYKILNYQQYRDKDYTAAARQRKHRELSRVTGVTSPSTYMSYASDVLSYLNLKTRKRYKNTKEILKRLCEGNSVDDLKSIIDTKLHDPHFIDNPQYLNPITLFRKCHIDNYLNQRPEDFKSKPIFKPIRQDIRPNSDDSQWDEEAYRQKSLASAKTRLELYKQQRLDRELTELEKHTISIMEKNMAELEGK